MITKHTIAEHAVFLALVAFSFAPAIANAQNATPWWQKVVKSVVHKAEQKVEHAGTGTVNAPKSTNSSTNSPPKDERKPQSTETQTTQTKAGPNTEVALKGAFYNYYKYTFSGELKLRLSGFKNRSYTGWVISAGPPDYKIKSFKLDIGGLTTGWKLSNATTSSYWAWDRPEGSLRVHLTVAAPGDQLPSGGEATINIFGTFMGNYTFSTTNSMTRTPVGPPSFADKIIMQNSGATYMAHYVKRTAAPVALTYPGVSLDILGVKPGMSLKAAKRILVAHYKSRPISSSKKLSLSYKDSVFLSSQPFVSELDDRNKGQSDSIQVIFGNPTISNIVIGVVRKLNFDQTHAPKMSQLMAALNKKYGPESSASNGDRTWIFGEHALIKSKSTGDCPTANPVVNFDNYSPYSPGSAPPEYACVKATFAPLVGDDSRAAWVTVTLYNLADTELSNEEAMRQMHAAVVGDYKRVIKPAKVPTL